MTRQVIDKKVVESELRSAIGADVCGFAEKPGETNACSVAVREDIEESKWVGKWTERIREIVRSVSPGASCVCVKPLPNGRTVWYRVSVA